MMRLVVDGVALLPERPDVLFWRTDVVEPVVHELETPGNIRIDAEHVDGARGTSVIIHGAGRSVEEVASLVEFVLPHMADVLDGRPDEEGTR